MLEPPPLRDARVAGRLDWCCIGAQKAGTSTLYRLLRDHPQIRIPSSKEDPIFDRDTSADLVREYLDERFADPGTARCGTVTPQYLSDPATAGRLHRFVPDAKIVVLLRDPVARAYSHYKMSVLRELDTRSFDDAAADQLRRLRAGAAVELESETDSYVVRGNYGWLLEGWLRRYGPANVLCVFSDELDADTETALARVQAFLDVDPRRPEDLDFRFNASPPRHRLSGLRKPVARALRRVGWDRLDVERKEKVSSFLERSLARFAPVPADAPSPETTAALRAYYAADGARLAELIGTRPPWLAA